jgi:hypothetical protein
VSLAAPVQLTAVHPLLRWRRHYTGQLVTLALAGRPGLRLTPGHPVLTHIGWRRADALVPGAHVVAAPPDRTATDADLAYERDRDLTGPGFTLPVDNADFRGDGDRFSVTVLCLDETRGWPPPRPYTGNEGARPRVWPADVAAVLDALCTPAEFGEASWANACARVPGLAQAYPAGPVPRHDGISAQLRHRLGAALAALPPAPLDRGDLGDRLLGLSVPLGLVEVTDVALAPTVAVVHDVTDAHGAITAAGVVVAG